MATGWPMKTTYANGDVYSAGDVNDITGTINLLGQSVTTSAGKNGVINGGFDIWQRGTSVGIAPIGSGYTADRWAFYAPAVNQNYTISRQVTGDTTNLPTIQYCARVQRNSGQTGTQTTNFGNSFETTNSIRFVGQAVTLSFYARRGANYSPTSNALVAVVYSGTGTDQNRVAAGYTGDATVVTGTATLTTTWQRFTYTGTVGATATELAVSFQNTPTGTAGANDFYEITGVQLELGSTATTFSRAGGTIQGELAACQRYFEALVDGTGGVDGTLSIGFNYTTVLAVSTINYTSKRVNPSISLSSGNLEAQLTGGAIAALSAVGFASPTATACQIYGSCSGITTGQGNQFRSGTVAYVIHISAEL